jgi:hypothetical protein
LLLCVDTISSLNDLPHSARLCLSRPSVPGVDKVYYVQRFACDIDERKDMGWLRNHPHEDQNNENIV